jgi:hypothetical protein
MMERQSREYYQELERLLNKSLNDLKAHISEQDYRDVQEYIEHGEYGIGWELLWHLVVDKKLEASNNIIACGQKMGFDVSRS